MSDLHVPAGDSPCVPVRSLLRPSTYRALAAAAEQHGTDVGGLLARMADRSVVPNPARKRERTRRAYWRATDDDLQRVRDLNAAGLNDTQIAAALGIEKHQANYLRDRRLGLPGNP